ncbi:MarR family transcriptional regulator [Streptomyces sp. NPDC002911]
MAIQHTSSALRAPASSRPYPMAKSGYGKRTMPGQLPRSADDYALLPARERYVAGFVDQLPDGASMDVKSLAKQLPLYGQQAVASALKALATAGYLRRVRCLVGELGQVRWVTRTFWSRTARDNEWWAATEVTPAATTAAPQPCGAMEPPAPTPPEPAPAPAVPPQRTPAPGGPSLAYLALAQLGRVDSRLPLSAADCAVLEGLAAEWFARGVDTDYFTQALASGLPPEVGSPVGFVRRRLTDKLPPHLPAAPAPPAPGTPVHRVMLECTKCGTPGRPEALPDGLCRPCRLPGEDVGPEEAVGRPSEQDVRTFAAGLRDLLKSP